MSGKAAVAGACPNCREYLMVVPERMEEMVFVWECFHCSTMFITGVNYFDNYRQFPDS